MTQVKICGIGRVEDALVAAEAGADLLGFVFAPSRRRIEPERARRIAEQVRDRSAIKMVGVFVNEDAAEMNRIAALCDLDYVQLSGDEPDELIADIAVPAIQVVHMRQDVDLAARLRSPAPLLLLDTAQAGSYGGSGRAFDWSRIPPLDRPVLLAGGLHPGNVADAIRNVRPWGVDVSSGVERDGRKDPAQIRAFIENAKRAMQDNGQEAIAHRAIDIDNE